MIFWAELSTFKSIKFHTDNKTVIAIVCLLFKKTQIYKYNLLNLSQY